MKRNFKLFALYGVKALFFFPKPMYVSWAHSNSLGLLRNQQERLQFICGLLKHQREERKRKKKKKRRTWMRQGEGDHKTRERDRTKLKESLMDLVEPRGSEVDTHLVRFLIFFLPTSFWFFCKGYGQERWSILVCVCVWFEHLLSHSFPWVWGFFLLSLGCYEPFFRFSK